MRFLFAISFALLSVFPQEAKSVVGGAQVSSESKFAKFAVLLKHYESKDFARCSGTLIADDIILTAAHCFPKQVQKNSSATVVHRLPHTNEDGSIGIVFGKTVDSVGIELSAVSYAVHPGYDDADEKLDDLALIRFTGKLPDGIQPARVFLSKTPMGVFATALGYGLEEYLGDNTVITEPLLKAVDIEVTSVSPRHNALLFKIDSTNGVSKGDSGGPLVIDVAGELKIAGVSAYITTKDNPTSATYTIVAPYMEWIRETVTEMRALPAQ